MIVRRLTAMLTAVLPLAITLSPVGALCPLATRPGWKHSGTPVNPPYRTFGTTIASAQLCHELCQSHRNDSPPCLSATFWDNGSDSRCFEFGKLPMGDNVLPNPPDSFRKVQSLVFCAGEDSGGPTPTPPTPSPPPPTPPTSPGPGSGGICPLATRADWKHSGTPVNPPYRTFGTTIASAQLCHELCQSHRNDSPPCLSATFWDNGASSRCFEYGKLPVGNNVLPNPPDSFRKVQSLVFCAGEDDGGNTGPSPTPPAPPPPTPPTPPTPTPPTPPQLPPPGLIDCGGVWTAGAPVPASIGEVTAGYDSKNGLILVVGEGNTGTFVYNIAKNSWSTTAKRPHAGNHHSAVIIGRNWYLVGGLDSNSENKIQIYNFDNKTWKLGATMLYDAGSVSSAVHKGEIYTCGGITTKSRTTKQCSKYTPSSDTWTSLPGINQERNHAASCASGSELLIIGGRDGGNVVGPAFSEFLRYSMASARQLSNGVPLPTPRGGMGVCLSTASALWVFGGELGRSQCSALGAAARANSGCAIESGVILKAGSKRWQELPRLPVGKHGIFPVAAGGRVYIIAGGVKAANSNSVSMHHASLADLEACAD